MRCRNTVNKRLKARGNEVDHVPPSFVREAWVQVQIVAVPRLRSYERAFSVVRVDRCTRVRRVVLPVEAVWVAP